MPKSGDPAASCSAAARNAIRAVRSGSFRRERQLWRRARGALGALRARAARFAGRPVGAVADVGRDAGGVGDRGSVQIEIFQLRQVPDGSQARVGDVRIAQPEAPQIRHAFEAAHSLIVEFGESRIQRSQPPERIERPAGDIRLPQRQLAQIGEILDLVEPGVSKPDPVEEVITECERFQRVDAGDRQGRSGA